MSATESEILGVDEKGLQLFKLLQPEAAAKRVAAYNNKTRFVHYTTASAAAAMIGGQSVWLRNTTTMNDVSEVSFGIDRVVRHFARKSNSKTAITFWKAMAEIDPWLPDKITADYDSLLNALRMDTYIFSLSEHHSTEDELGRLSMWRAYGGTQGVALVVNPAPFFGNSDALATYSYPVVYQDDKEAEVHFREIAEKLESSVKSLREWPVDVLKESIVGMLESYSICLKHPGFMEEQEWRIVYQPKRRWSDRMVGKLVEIRGLPQLVYELPLVDVPEEGLTGISPAALLEKIIIGPTQYPVALFDYFNRALGNAGIRAAHERVIVSNIPLRT